MTCLQYVDLWVQDGPQASCRMNRQTPVHEIRLGAVRASIWEEPGHEGPRYRVSITRAIRPSEAHARADRFEAEDLPLVVEVADLAHLWICEQAELIA